MNRYTILCTEHQTRKALVLNAPIEYSDYISSSIPLPKDWFPICDKCFHIPTAEQMIGWLEEQGRIKEIAIFQDSPANAWSYIITIDGRSHVFYEEAFESRKEATLAAIDTALEYLENLKQ